MPARLVWSGIPEREKLSSIREPDPDQPLPDDEGAEDRQGQNGEAEIQPGPIRFCVLRQNEHVNPEPQAYRKTQRHSNEITWCLVNRPNTFVLRTGDARGDHNQDADEQCSKNHRCNPNAARWRVFFFRGFLRVHDAPAAFIRVRPLSIKLTRFNLASECPHIRCAHPGREWYHGCARCNRQSPRCDDRRRDRFLTSSILLVPCPIITVPIQVGSKPGRGAVQGHGVISYPLGIKRTAVAA
jgi:hypothetical protein